MFYTYVLKSSSDNELYIGWTDDLNQRIRLHNNGKVPSTKNRRPFILVYCEICLNRKKAIAREKSLKTGFGRKYLKNWI